MYHTVFPSHFVNLKKNPVIVTMATGWEGVTGHAVTRGKYKTRNKHHSPTTRQDQGREKVKETLKYSFYTHQYVIKLISLVCLRYFSSLNPKPFALLPILRHPVYKYCSAGLTKIWTRLWKCLIKSNHIIATVSKRSNSARFLLIKRSKGGVLSRHDVLALYSCTLNTPVAKENMFVACDLS